MSLIEKIFVKILGNTKGFKFNMCDWDILTLAEKCRIGSPLTASEIYAKTFIEQMGEYIELWNPSEKWVKPYGDVLNEHRNLS